MLARTMMVRGLPSIEHPNQFVKDVSLASNQGRAFQKKLVQEQPSHCNLFILMCGPIKPSSLGKFNYFLLFIDDLGKKNVGLFFEAKI